MAKSYQTTLDTELTPSQFLMLTSLSMDDLKWQHTFIDNNTIEAQNWLGNNTQKVKVSIDGRQVMVDSKYDSWVISDFGKNRKTTEQLLNTIEEKKELFTPEDLDAKFQQLVEDAASARADFEERVATGELTASEKMAIGAGGHYITYSLLALNILFFAFMVVNGVGIFEPETTDLIKWGANVKFLTESGDWWRLVSAMFMHIGIVHLLFNMYALFSIGMYLEPVMSRWKFLVAYLCTGVIASLTSIWWHDNTASAGASGAIFGMYGIFLAMLTTKMFDKTAQKSLLSSIGVFVFYNLVYGMKAGVDNAAHIGGLISGLVLGYQFSFLHNTEWRKLFSVIAIVLTAATSILFLQGKQNDDPKFYSTWDEISTMELKALEPLQKKDSISSEVFIKQSETISLPLWKQAKERLASTSNFKLTEALQYRRNLLIEYIDLRIEFTQALIDAEKTNDWEKASELGSKIQSVLEELNAEPEKKD